MNGGVKPHEHRITRTMVMAQCERHTMRRVWLCVLSPASSAPGRIRTSRAGVALLESVSAVPSWTTRRFGPTQSWRHRDLPPQGRWSREANLARCRLPTPESRARFLAEKPRSRTDDHGARAMEGCVSLVRGGALDPMSGFPPGVPFQLTNTRCCHLAEPVLR